MAKRVFLIHGWDGHADGAWRPWLKNELEKKGFTVTALAMPDAGHPKMGAWVKHLAKTVDTPDKDCYLVGHSMGCITVLRYLESLKADQKIGGAILVAGFTSDLGYGEIVGSFFQKPIDWKEITSHCKKFVAVHSDNDPYVSLHYADIFKEKLGSKVIVEHNMKHFGEDDNIKQLPVVLNQLLEISK